MKSRSLRLATNGTARTRTTAMIWSLLLLIAMSIMVFTMRGGSSTKSSRKSTQSMRSPVVNSQKGVGSDGGLRHGPSVKVAAKRISPDGKVSYRLMNEHLPTPSQRLWRSMMRFARRPKARAGNPDATASTPPSGATPQSAELQSFLDARRKNRGPRDDDTKRGPDETLH